MVRDPGKPSPPNPEALFSATEAPLPSSPRFWVRLLTQRSWMLLGGLWLLMVCVAAVASHRLLFTDPANARGASRTPSEVSASRGASGSAQPGDGSPVAADTASDRPGVGVALWGISSLVGVCALGSVVISQQAKAAARRRSQPKRRVRRVKAKAKAPTGPKRLQPYSPDRDAVIVKGAQAVRDTLPLSLVEAESESDLLLDLFDDNHANTPPSPSLNQASSAPQAQSSVQGPGGKVKQARPPVVADSPAPQPPTLSTEADASTHRTEVMPQDEAHPLDWTEDSLAHVLDLRQRRSLSSLM